MMDIRQCAYAPNETSSLTNLSSYKLSLMKQGGEHDITAHIQALATEMFKNPPTSPYKMSLTEHQVRVWDPLKPHESITLKHTQEGWMLHQAQQITPLTQDKELSEHTLQILAKVQLAWKQNPPASAATPLPTSPLVKHEVEPIPSDLKCSNLNPTCSSSLKSVLSSLENISSELKHSYPLITQQTALLQDLNHSLHQLHITLSSLTLPHQDEFFLSPLASSVSRSSQEDEDFNLTQERVELDIIPDASEPLFSSSLLTEVSKVGDCAHHHFPSSFKPLHPNSSALEEAQQKILDLELINTQLSLQLQTLKDDYKLSVLTASGQTEELKALYENYAQNLALTEQIRQAYQTQLQQDAPKQEERTETSSSLQTSIEKTQQAALTQIQPQAVVTSSPISPLTQNLDELQKLNSFFTTLAEGKMLKEQLVGPVLINLAYLDSSFPEQFSEKAYTAWIKSKIKTPLPSPQISSYLKSLEVHLGKYKKEKIAPKLTFPNLEKLSGYLSMTLQDQQMMNYLTDLASSLNKQDLSPVLQKNSLLAPKMRQFQDKLKFSLTYYAQLTSQKAATPEQAKKFKEAENISTAINHFLSHMLKNFNQTDWEIGIKQ
ncbi:MAG: hypothetical protein QRY72_00875 [Candidatus Rhabdochlamydia sp.]